MSKSWLWAASAALLTSHLEHKLLDQKIKEFKEKEAIFGWVGLAFFVSLVLKWTICTVSFALILAAHTTKLQAQLLAHPFIHRLWRTCKKTHPLCNLQTERVYSCCCCWRGPCGRGQLPPGLPPSHHPAKPLSLANIISWTVKLLSACPVACPWKSNSSQELINREKARQSLLFNLEPW